MRAAIFSLVLAGSLAGPALADDAPKPDTIQHNRAILAAAPAAAGVFTVADDGSIHHSQSGMVCPADFPNVRLWRLLVFPTNKGPGMDVACDYGRAGPDGNWIAKLTLFATAAPEGWKLDDVFASYRGEVVQADPGLISIGPAVTADQRPVPDPAGDLRSEEFQGFHDGRPFTSSLIVALRGPWMFEVRASYVGRPDELALDPNAGVDGTVQAIGDRVMAAQAFFRVVQTLPK